MTDKHFSPSPVRKSAIDWVDKPAKSLNMQIAEHALWGDLLRANRMGNWRIENFCLYTIANDLRTSTSRVVVFLQEYIQKYP